MKRLMIPVTLLIGALIIPACGHSTVRDVTAVRTLNTHSGAGNYSIRLRAIADAIKEDWPHGVGLIAIQEAKPDMANCHCGGWSGPDHSAKCLQLLLTERMVPADTAVAWGGKHALGVVVGKPWSLVSWNFWPIGRDNHIVSLDPDTRYLLEAHVSTRKEGKTLRFYSTHLSHDSRSFIGTPISGRVERQAQIATLKSLIRGRVQPGELPPIIAGDFNIAAGESESMDAMTADFELIYSNSVDLIWRGKAASFPGCSGSMETVGQAATTDLKSSRTVHYTFGGAAHSYTGQLSDHDSPRINLKIVP